MPIVAIEGIDGSGKTTQTKMLVSRLRDRGCRTVYIQPAYLLMGILFPNGARGNVISPRKVATDNAYLTKSVNHTLSLLGKRLFGLFGYLYALVTCVLLRFCRNRIVFCDRYFYQFIFDLFDDRSYRVLKYLPKPDMTFFLNNDLESLRLRMNEIDFEVSREYYIRAYNFYKTVSEKEGFITIDGSLDRNLINDIIFEILEDKIIAKKERGACCH